MSNNKAHLIASTPDLDTFLASYVTCALWASTADNGDPLDKDHSKTDISTETLCTMREECALFIKENLSYIGTQFDQAGHDFWLTRNGHGTGYWDRDCYGSNRDKLSESATAKGERYLYIGDDGLIYM